MEMETNYKPKQTTHQEKEEEEEEVFTPVSPLSQSLNSSFLSLFILTIFELENPIHESEMLEFFRTKFIPISPCFTSIIVNDKDGVPRWKKVEIQYEDHIIVPTFPLGLQSREEYDEHLRVYLSEIGCEKLSESKPLWEAHLIKYPSLKGAGTLIVKFSHAIGDGYSFIKVLISGLKRADNPALPLTFPNLSLRKYEAIKGNYLGFFSKCINTISDVAWNILKSTILEDGSNAIRSGKADVQLRPFSIYSLTLSLEQVKQVKSKLGSTVNDIISGIISYAIHLYMTKMGQISNVSSNMTLLVMVNMRTLKGYNNIDEMLRETDTRGNQSRLLHVTIPSFTNLEKVSPLDFIIKAREAMERKKNSMYIYFIEPVLSTTRRVFGQKGYAQLVYLSFKNASTMITSVIGPKEKMALVGNPVGSFYFLVTGIPQSLTFTSVSCMGELKLVATMEKGFIDSQIFSSCMDEAVANIFEAAIGKDTKNSV